MIKVPGPQVRVGPVAMDFRYSDYFKVEPNTGYERLLHDCMVGDATLFRRADMVEAGWAIVDPILDVWRALRPRNFPNYAAGTWGPADAFNLIERDGRHWRPHAPVIVAAAQPRNFTAKVVARAQSYEQLKQNCRPPTLNRSLSKASLRTLTRSMA